MYKVFILVLVVISDFMYWIGVCRCAVRSPKSVRQESRHGMFRCKVLGSVLVCILSVIIFILL